MLDVLQRSFKRHLTGGANASGVVFTRGPDVRHLLSPGNIHGNVIFLDVFANDLSFVDPITGLYEEVPTIVKL